MVIITMDYFDFANEAAMKTKIEDKSDLTSKIEGLEVRLLSFGADSVVTGG